MKIALIDDHLLVVEGFKNIIERNILGSEITLFCSSLKFYEDYKKCQEFDLIITDIEMHKMNGVELITKVLEINNNQKIIAISMHKDVGLIKQLFDIGCKGFIAKSCNSTELLKAIKTVLKGDEYLHKKIETFFILNKEEKLSLTRRELQIVKEISNGLNSKEIANKINVAESTVKTHRKNIFLKLDVTNSAELIKTAFQKKLIY